MKIRNFGSQEREEYDALVNQVLNGDRIVNADKAHRFRLGLEDAVQAHRPWAQDVLANATEYGLRKILKDRAKTEARTMIDYRGNIIAKTTRIGRRRKSASGVTFFDQALMDDFTWDELREWLDQISRQISAMFINKDMADRLLSLHERFPDSATPREACALLGTTVNDYLARKAA